MQPRPGIRHPVFSKIAIVAASAALATLTACVSIRPEPAFTRLFNGRDLSGWTFVGAAGQEFVIEDGILVSPEKSHGNLYTDREYSDFVLRLEYKVGAGGNNGIGIRSPLGKPGEQPAFTGMEVQILDDKAPKHAKIKPWQSNGSVYGIFAAQDGAPRINEWNAMEITCSGRQIKVVLNGREIVNGNINDVTDPELLKKHPGMLRPKGRIALLGHNDRVEFRNIRIRELPASTRENTPPAGFTSLFTGSDLSGWKGLAASPIKKRAMSPAELAEAQAKADELMRQNWKIEEGAIVYRGNGFDNLVSGRDYGDFELWVDWKISKKGDSGLYLRGTPQVQIWDNPEGSGALWNNKTHPNKPLRNADRFPGEWNTFRILMVGEKVTVFLNDELIVNTVTLENFWERDQPVYATGPIELQAHQDEVHFKNIYVREIPRQ